jgi:N-acetyl-anhydromuramoyl-L-alanine amidase
LSERQSVPAAAALWQDGWYRFARRLDSPNFGTRPRHTAIDLIVVHSISLPPAQYGGPEVLDFFTNQLDCGSHPYFEQIRGLAVSAHFFIRRGGELWQLVSCDHRAWHAGQSAWQGRSNCNDFSVGIELEGIEGGVFEAAQYESLIQVSNALKQHYPIHALVGHEHIAPERKKDPGAGFDWLQVQRALLPFQAA